MPHARLVFVAVVALAVGYVAGREHLKYQIAQRVTDTAQAAAARIGEAWQAHRERAKAARPEKEKAPAAGDGGEAR